MKIRSKLILAFVFLGFVAMIISIIAERPIRSKLAVLGDLHAPVLFAIQSIESDLKGAVEESLAYVVSGSEEEKREYLAWQQSFDENIVVFAGLLERLDLSDEQTEFEAELLASVVAGQRRLTEASEKMFEEYESLGAVSRTTFDIYEETIDQLVTDIEAFVEVEKVELDEANALAIETIENSRVYLLASGALVLAIATISSLVLAGFVTRPLENIVAAAVEIGRGNLDRMVIVDSRDEIGALAESFNGMIANLKKKTTSVENLNREIADRKNAEAELQYERNYLAAMINALPDLLFDVDAEGRIFDFRAPDPNLFYVPSETFLGQLVTEVLPESAAPVVMQGIAEAAETGSHRGGTFPLDMPGGIRWFELSIAVRGERAPDAHYVTLVRDITDRAIAEGEKLTVERQVQHAQKLESLGILAGGIAHDFNNLLVGILGNADLAMEELSPMSPARANIKEIEKASRRAADLANQMLAYSGKGHFVVEPIDINELINEMAYLLEASTSKKAILKYNLGESPPFFRGDSTQIRQVIMNLITNASEAIGEAEGVITLSSGVVDGDRALLDEFAKLVGVSMEERLPEGAYIFLEVADTGLGMDAETLQRVFDPFFTTKFTGRGLGMSAVLGIVRGHGGGLKIYSEPGRGTTFKILFPVDESARAGEAIPASSDDEPKDWRGSGTVLIVDDEELVLGVGKHMLERIGFDVLTAPDGREALELYREHLDEIPCVILDLTMPHMDGLDAFREMRRINADVAVILSSGYNEQDAVQRFAGKGLVGFIQKPYMLSQLRQKLRVALAPRTSKFS